MRLFELKCDTFIALINQLLISKCVMHVYANVNVGFLFGMDTNVLS